MSFLDGFTMAGFLSKLRRPDAAAQMFASIPRSTAAQSLTFEATTKNPDAVEFVGDLRSVPEPVLRTMITLLTREDEERKLSQATSQKAGYGTSR